MSQENSDANRGPGASYKWAIGIALILQYNGSGPYTVTVTKMPKPFYLDF
ncbi:MAG: hypothetical protein IPO16_09885 [Saprospiraceae bacterium]|nr:hypothetical protein [Saprospiraceae bacterium]